MSVRLFHDDCLRAMSQLSEKSVDMILVDPPYGTTACAWDSVIDLPSMRAQIRRVRKPNVAVVVMAAQPFTTALIHSNIGEFKYSWVWEKSRPSGFAQAKNMPLKGHEDICVFSDGVTVHASQSRNRMPYFPQGTERLETPVKLRKVSWSDSSFSKRPSHGEYEQEVTNYPRSVLRFASEGKTVHPTQKPVPLLEYLIRTYTSPGETVLDFTMGSGSTGVARARTGRRFIGVEADEKYFRVAKARIDEAALEVALS
jgi:site-specific DNA-methyltransferase (adenine-specific)